MSISMQKYIIILMSVREDIKILLVKEKMTLTELAEALTQKTGRNYNVNGLSQKLRRSSMQYDEAKLIADVLGYKIKFEKINID